MINYNTVGECQVNFGFLPVKYQLFIRTAEFLQKFIASENSLRIHCLLVTSASSYMAYSCHSGKNIQTACQLRNAVYSNFLVMCDILLLCIAHTLFLS